ncbi:dentin sialophosphoprotein-like isoform X2 [Physella acuta]|uniref:dentin sialophosphoprotein-like isoform X2 n=1 Tax=Physella acuta TaxID=109671 RepID=UPI0027DE1166|nr:dentin sialophosphoprotein-like isoform X2 [Physella acuta]
MKSLCFLYVVSSFILTVSSFPYDTCICDAGSYLKEDCVPGAKPKCEQCSFGTFTENANKEQQCTICSICPVQTYAALPCSTSKDTVCVPCSKPPAKKSESFLLSCGDEWGELMQKDEPVGFGEGEDASHQTEKPASDGENQQEDGAGKNEEGDSGTEEGGTSKSDDSEKHDGDKHEAAAGGKPVDGTVKSDADGEKQGANDAEKQNADDAEKQNGDDAEKTEVGDAEKPGDDEAEKPGAGDADKPEVGDAEKPEVGDAEKPEVGDAEKPDVIDIGKQDDDDAEKPDAGDAEKQDAGDAEKQDAGDAEKPDAGDAEKPDAGDAEKQVDDDAGKQDDNDAGKPEVDSEKQGDDDAEKTNADDADKPEVGDAEKSGVGDAEKQETSDDEKDLDDAKANTDLTNTNSNDKSHAESTTTNPDKTDDKDSSNTVAEEAANDNKDPEASENLVDTEMDKDTAHKTTESPAPLGMVDGDEEGDVELIPEVGKVLESQDGEDTKTTTTASSEDEKSSTTTVSSQVEETHLKDADTKEDTTAGPEGGEAVVVATEQTTTPKETESSTAEEHAGADAGVLHEHEPNLSTAAPASDDSTPTTSPDVDSVTSSTATEENAPASADVTSTPSPDDTTTEGESEVHIGLPAAAETTAEPPSSTTTEPGATDNPLETTTPEAETTVAETTEPVEAVVQELEKTTPSPDTTTGSEAVDIGRLHTADNATDLDTTAQPDTDTSTHSAENSTETELPLAAGVHELDHVTTANPENTTDSNDTFMVGSKIGAAIEESTTEPPSTGDYDTTTIAPSTETPSVASSTEAPSVAPSTEETSTVTGPPVSDNSADNEYTVEVVVIPSTTQKYIHLFDLESTSDSGSGQGSFVVRNRSRIDHDDTTVAPPAAEESTSSPSVAGSLGKEKEDEEAGRKRTAIIVGVSVGGVALFALSLFVARKYCRKRKQYKGMKKVDKNVNGDEKIEFRPLPTSDIYEEPIVAKRTNGMYAQGPSKNTAAQSPIYRKKEESVEPEDVYAVPNKIKGGKLEVPLIPEEQGLSESPSANEPLMKNHKEKIKYIDDSTDDEGFSSVREKLLPAKSTVPNLSYVAEETPPATPAVTQSPPLTPPSFKANGNGTPHSHSNGTSPQNANRSVSTSSQGSFTTDLLNSLPKQTDQNHDSKSDNKGQHRRPVYTDEDIEC